MREPVFPVPADCHAFVFSEDLIHVQHGLRQLFLAGGFIGMAEKITQKPDIINTAGRFFCDPDKTDQRVTVLMQV